MGGYIAGGAGLIFVKRSLRNWKRFSIAWLRIVEEIDIDSLLIILCQHWGGTRKGRFVQCLSKMDVASVVGEWTVRSKYIEAAGAGGNRQGVHLVARVYKE